MKIKILTATLLAIGLSLAGFLNFVTMEHSNMGQSACGAIATLKADCASPATTTDNCLIFHLGMLNELSQANVQTSPLSALLLLAALTLISIWLKPSDKTLGLGEPVRARLRRIFSNSIACFYKKLNHWLALHEQYAPRHHFFGAGVLTVIEVRF